MAANPSQSYYPGGSRASGDPHMEVFYATRDGQSRRIAERIAERLAEWEIDTLPKDLGVLQPSQSCLESAGLVVLVAAIRYGKLLPEARDFLAAYQKLETKPKLVFLVVNLSSRKPGKETPKGSVYIRKAMKQYELAPAFARAIPGRLDYRRYTWRDRQLIRFIMFLTGGPTDPKTSIEYTPWDVVDDIANKIADLNESIPAASESNAVL
jgi:menaquinone-dependent protoporphyrinogen oxidase